MPLPNTGMTFTPFDPLPASDLNDLVENIEALQDTSAFDNGTISQRLLTNPVMFSAHMVAAQSPATNTKINLDTELYDIGNNFDTTTHAFTAPYNGYYHFDGAVTQLITTGSQTQCALRKNSANVKVGNGPIFNNSGGNQTMGTTVSADIKLASGDTIDLATGSASTAAAYGSPELTYLNGRLLMPY